MNVFIIERLKGESWDEIERVSLSATSFKDVDGLVKGEIYYYRVKKVKDGAVFLPPPTLSAREVLEEAPSTIELSWSDNE